MKHVIPEYIFPLFVSITLALGLSHSVMAKEYSLADVDKATFASDVATIETIYNTSEGRVKHVAGYRLLSMKMFVEKDVTAGKALLEKLVQSLENDLESTRKNGEGWALLASYRGFQIMNAPEYASVYGPKIGLEFALAEDYGKSTPTVFLIKGINLYNTPKEYGGSKERALALLEKAVNLYQASEEGAHWGEMDAYAWRGKTYLALGQKDKARADFERANTLAPGNPWLQGILASTN